ncbi:MAG TPA: MltR family transcriptional regulator [Pyrinomonadaceae bacterium]|nr:transcriptional regulator [Acidobacteriota bacterium]HQZ98079.1 MltR family transcriptional regulator [Pyrinomonadaceae bacterium]
MHAEDNIDFEAFLQELQTESDRGLALISAALIDEKLLETLLSFTCEDEVKERLLKSPNAPLGTFSARSDACFALGLIDEFEFREISLLRKVRNEFAHAKHGMSFQNDRVKGLCSAFKSGLPPGAEPDFADARARFINATITLVTRLYYRADWVSPERRQTKSWVPEGTSQWRSVNDELPPEGVPVLGFVKKKTVADKR